MNQPRSDFSNPAMAMAEMTDIVVDQIRKLAELRDHGILTEEEFADKKSELLARI